MDPACHLRARVERVLEHDADLLTRARAEVRHLMPAADEIGAAAATECVAIASAEAAFRLEPVDVRVVRVADSDGNRLLEQAVSLAAEPETIAEAHAYACDPVASLMAELGADSLHELSPAIPPPGAAGSRRARSWLPAYRDLCEWAALYERACLGAIECDTVVLRGGLLGTTALAHEASSAIGARIAERARSLAPRRLHLAGVARRADVLSDYGLALELERALPPGRPRLARVPLALERSPGATAAQALSGSWLEDDASALFVARLGARASDALCAIDLVDAGCDNAQVVAAAVARDARDGFPALCEPRSLQRAAAHAAFSEVDLRWLGEAAADTVRRFVGNHLRPVLEPALFGRRAA